MNKDNAAYQRPRQEHGEVANVARIVEGSFFRLHPDSQSDFSLLFDFLDTCTTELFLRLSQLRTIRGHLSLYLA